MAYESNTINVTDQVSWNLAQQIIMQIGNLLQTASSAFLRGSLASCFYHYQEVKILIFADINDKEKKILSELEEKFYSSCGSLNKDAIRVSVRPELFSKLEPYISQHKNTSSFILREYRETIISLLAKYGYHIAKKEDTGRMF